MNHSQMFLQAQWVTPAREMTAPYFQAQFDCAAALSGRLRISGLGFFSATLNGRPVSEDMFVPVWSDYEKREFLFDGAPFDEEFGHRIYGLSYDVSALLVPGQNTLLVHVTPGWYAQPTWVGGDQSAAYGRPRLCFALEYEDENGAHTLLSGPDTVVCRESEITAFDLFQGETQDYTRPLGAWERVRALEPFACEHLWQDCPADGVERRIAPKLLHQREGLSVYDQGENVTGTPVLLGTEPGTITVIFSEALGADGLPDPTHHHGQKAVFHIREPRTLRAIGTWYGYRYFSVQGPAQVLCCEVIHSKVPVTSTFHAPEPTLQWLYDAFLRTQLANMHAGIPSDCPHLERRGYTGDGQLVCEAGMMLLGSRDFYRKWLRDIADCQDRKTGHMQYTAPYTRCGGGPGGWGCAIVQVPYQYYRQFGDAQPMREMYPQMLRWFDSLEAHSEGGLVTSDKPGLWCLGDWCMPGKPRIPEPLVNTYFYIRSLRQACTIAEILGIDGERDLLKARIAERENALYQHYYDPQTGDFAENAQGANAFMVDLGLGDARTLEHIAQRYAALGEYDTGIFGTDIVTRVLFERGHKALAAKLLTSCGASSYGHMRLTGATTLYEYWHGGRSYSHPMFGAPVRYLFQHLLGVRQVEGSCAWREIVFDPYLPEGVNELSGSLETPQGVVRARLRRENGEVRAEIFAPEGMRVRREGSSC